MAGKEVTLVNDQVVQVFERMEPRHVALLIAKILNPDAALIELSGELWPELGNQRRNQIIHESQVTKIYAMVKNRPWLLAAIMANKLAPIAMAVLYELTVSAQKENVRATAAKEIIRLAQSTANGMAPSPEEPVPAEELDGLLNEIERSQLERISRGEIEQDDDDEIDDPEGVLINA